MVMRLRGAILVAQFCVSWTLSAAPNDTLIDVFPLHVGNAWTYSYFAQTIEQTGNTLTDSGTARFVITRMTLTQDTAIWSMFERRNLQHLIHHWEGNPPDSTYPIIDSTTYTIFEVLSGRHRLFRNEPESAIWNSVFPWASQLSDTAFVYRYGSVDSSGIVRIVTHSSPPPSYLYVYHLVFERGIGEIGGEASTGPFTTGISQEASYSLMGVVITSVQGDQSQRSPVAPRLFQNYPNPFNPTTTMSYALPQRTHVTLSVFNTLGLHVASLVDAVEEPGEHSVRFDAGMLASGVYYYRMIAGNYSVTRKLLFVR